MHGYQRGDNQPGDTRGETTSWGVTSDSHQAESRRARYMQPASRTCARACACVYVVCVRGTVYVERKRLLIAKEQIHLLASVLTQRERMKGATIREKTSGSTG